MTVNSKKTSDYFVFLEKNVFLCSIILIILFMVRYISAVSVVLAPKIGIDSMMSVDVRLDSVSGSTLFHAVEFVSKSPLVKSFLNKYNIINMTFNYSTL
jgi:hypothetical protein